MYQSKDIAIVILTWNGKALLKKYLPSVLSFSDSAAIYVADNASRDESINYIKRQFPSVTIIKNKKNEGYAKGYNNVLKQIKEPIYCLLNNDVEVTKDWLKPIIKLFNTNNETAIIQPKILDFKHKSKFEYAGAAGGFIDKYGYPYCRGRIFDTIENDDNQYNDTAPIFWASGACFFIKKSVFKQLKGFDESYFAHMEEIDLCWRAYNTHHTTTYVGTSTVYHLGGATLNSTSSKKVYLNFRNSLFTLLKNTDNHVFMRLLIRMILDGIAALNFMLQLKPQYSFAIIKAHFSFYMNLRKLIRKRKTLPKRPNYYNMTSVIWSYFVLKNKKF